MKSAVSLPAAVASPAAPGPTLSNALAASGGVFGLLAIIINLLQDPALSKHVPYWLGRALLLRWPASMCAFG